MYVRFLWGQLELDVECGSHLDQAARDKFALAASPGILATLMHTMVQNTNTNTNSNTNTNTNTNTNVNTNTNRTGCQCTNPWNYGQSTVYSALWVVHFYLCNFKQNLKQKTKTTLNYSVNCSIYLCTVIHCETFAIAWNIIKVQIWTKSNLSPTLLNI